MITRESSNTPSTGRRGVTLVLLSQLLCTITVSVIVYSVVAGRRSPPNSDQHRPDTTRQANAVFTSSDIQIFNRTNTNQHVSLYSRDETILLFDPKWNKKCQDLVYSRRGRRSCAEKVEGDALQVHPACWQLWKRTPNVLHRMSLVYGAGGIFGFVAQGNLMSEVDYAALNFIFAANPNIGGNIVEFGTAMGLTSLYLGIASKLRGGTFVTYDYLETDCRDERVKAAWLDNMLFKQSDILSTRQECTQRGTAQREGVCVPCDEGVAHDVSQADFLLVDNGEKIHEASVYGKYMKLQSVIIVHDHWTQVV